MFRLLGTDLARKRYHLSNSSHVAAPTAERMKETLDWFDRYLDIARDAQGHVVLENHRAKSRSQASP